MGDLYILIYKLGHFKQSSIRWKKKECVCTSLKSYLHGGERKRSVLKQLKSQDPTSQKVSPNSYPIEKYNSTASSKN